MYPFFIFILLFPLLAFGYDTENIFQDDQAKIAEIFTDHHLHEKFHKGKSILFKTYSKDPDNRISKEFDIPPFFYNNVEFWFNIYTTFNSSHVVIHDKENLSIVYDIMDFSELTKKSVNIHIKGALQASLSLKRSREIRVLLKELSKKRKHSKKSRELQKHLKSLGLNIPKGRKAREKFFTGLARNVRTQTGQKDNIFNGIKNLKPFSQFIDQTFSQMKIPIELLAVPFLESSFNTRARSRVGAVGVWQFMRRTARSFMTVDRWQDGRVSPNLSTISALHLLAQNKQILKRWDLAVTAYNSGTKHIIKARRKLKKPRMSLELMLKKYKHPHIGFASMNFYSEFLALVHTLAYKNEIYDIKDWDNTHSKKIIPYVLICPISPKRYFQLMSRSGPFIKEINRHFSRKHNKRIFPRGTILFSDKKLNKKKYREVSPSEMRRNYPKNWHKLIKGYSCSKR